MTKEIILREEAEFPRLFADVCEKDYGLLFYQERNRECHDANHAILHPGKSDDLAAVLDDIRGFYLQKGITPRIYGCFEDERLLLEQRGWSVKLYGEDKMMLLTQQSQIDTAHRLDIRHLREWDERIAPAFGLQEMSRTWK